MKTPYDDVPGLAGLADEEKKRIVVSAAGDVFKAPSYFGLLVLQMAGFIGLVIWLPRGSMYMVIVFAYIFVTCLAMKRHWNRLVRRRIGESVVARAGR